MKYYTNLLFNELFLYVDNGLRELKENSCNIMMLTIDFCAVY